jgi:hypothetical protein
VAIEFYTIYGNSFFFEVTLAGPGRWRCLMKPALRSGDEGLVRSGQYVLLNLVEATDLNHVHPSTLLVFFFGFIIPDSMLVEFA